MKNLRKITAITFLSFFFQQAFCTEYPVTSAAEIKKLKLVPGDKIILQEGEWKDQMISFKGNGTAEDPITLTTNNPGKIILSGDSSIKIDGQYLVVDGLFFTDGFSTDKDVIDFSKTSSNCRVTNSSILNYSNPDKTVDYKWVSLRGSKNRVDHCSFTGKTHQGTLMVVWLDETANYHQIDHNYFGPRPSLEGNGGEIIRVGTSDWSMHDSFTTIEKNIFDNCDGETEIVSIKSGKNKIIENLFYECDGTLTLRHGNGNEVANNIFIGNQKANTGGIRVIGENHIIHDNYLQGLAGTNLRAAISVMNAVINPELKEYWQVRNAKIYNNMIVDCKEAFTLGSGKNETRIVAPDGLTITNNIVINSKKPLTKKDKPRNLTIKDNELKGSEEVIEGFVASNSKFKITNKIWNIKGQEKKLFWEEDIIGINWNASEFTVKIR